MKFRIKADWMQSCGRGNEAVTVDVVKHLGYMPNGKDAMYEVRMPDGSLWTVSDWRGEVIDGEQLDLAFAIDGVTLNMARRDAFSVAQSGAISYHLSGAYTLAALTSIVEDMRNVQSAYDRVTH